MSLKRLTATAAAIAAMTLAAAAQTAPEEHHLFPYPQPPEGLTILRERCNFLVYHFWDRADLRKVFDQPEGLNRAFADWVSFMPYCAPDTAHRAIKTLIASVAKDGRKLLSLADMAERHVYSDSADFVSEELYMPFAAAAATSRKVPEAQRSRFARDLRRINSTALGQALPAIAYTTPDGAPALFEADTVATMVVIADIDDTASTTASIRFSIDPATRSLVDAGSLHIAWLFAGPLTDAKREALGRMPEQWTRGVLPDPDDYFKLRISPAVFLMDEKNRIVLKDRPYTTALQVFNVMASQQ